MKGVRWVNKILNAAEMHRYREEKPTFVQRNSFLNSNNEHLL